MGTKYCGDEVVVVSGSDCSQCLDSTCETPCSDNCGCTPSNPGCPLPYYDEAPAVQQANCDVRYISNFYSSIKSSTAWNIPACGATAVLRFGCVKAILIGSNLWNGLYGYFEVTAYNAETGDVTVKNNCVSGNSAPGTAIPACTEFVVAPPPCCTGGTDLPYPYLKSNFVAPPVSGCLDIIVTSVNGLAVGKDVQIGSGVYRINGIASANLIQICNDGEGITPGTSVIAQNDAGDYQYPLILIDTNPCTNPVISSGPVLACDGGVTAPLTGLAAGSVLVLTDPVTGEAEYQVTGQPTFTCTILTQSVTTSIGIATYTLTVANSAEFSPTDIIQIGSRTDRFTVTSVPDATHIVGTLDPVPGSVQLIAAGTSVCLIGCCEEVQNAVDDVAADLQILDDYVQDFIVENLAIKHDLQVPANVTGSLIGDGVSIHSLVSNTASVSITNNANPAHNMVVDLHLSVACEFENELMDIGKYLNLRVVLQLEKNGGGFITQLGQADYYWLDTDVRIAGYRKDLSFSKSILVAPGDTDVYTVRAAITQSVCGAETYVTTLLPTISVSGVSV